MNRLIFRQGGHHPPPELEKRLSRLVHPKAKLVAAEKEPDQKPGGKTFQKPSRSPLNPDENLVDREGLEPSTN